jgi:hypothetical protein
MVPPVALQAADREIDDFMTSHARARGDEKIVQLLECFAEPTCTPGGGGTVDKVVHVSASRVWFQLFPNTASRTAAYSENLLLGRALPLPFTSVAITIQATIPKETYG